MRPRCKTMKPSVSVSRRKPSRVSGSPASGSIFKPAKLKASEASSRMRAQSLGMSAEGTSSRTWWNAQRLRGDERQFASVAVGDARFITIASYYLEALADSASPGRAPRYADRAARAGHGSLRPGAARAHAGAGQRSRRSAAYDDALLHRSRRGTARVGTAVRSLRPQADPGGGPGHHARGVTRG